MKLFIVMHQVDIVALSQQTLAFKFALILQGIKNASGEFNVFKEQYPDSKMLFVMPENTFSCAGLLNHYSESNANIIFNYFTALSQEYPDIMLLPGSVKHYKHASEESTAQAVKALNETGQWVHDTLTSHQKTFTPTFDDRAQKISKSDSKRIYCQNTAFIAYNGMLALVDKKVPFNELKTEYEQTHGIFEFGTTSNIVNIEGVKLGIEICCDNDFKLLRMDSKNPVDIHILISATIPTLTDTIACHQDGIYIHCDSDAVNNSIVINFNEGMGEELKPIVKRTDQGILAFAVELDIFKPDISKIPLTDDARAHIQTFKRKAVVKH